MADKMNDEMELVGEVLLWVVGPEEVVDRIFPMILERGGWRWRSAWHAIYKSQGGGGEKGKLARGGRFNGLVRVINITLFSTFFGPTSFILDLVRVSENLPLK